MKNNFRLFNEVYSKAICDANVEWTNEYTPKEKSTVKLKEYIYITIINILYNGLD